MSYTQDTIADMRKTARSKGAVGLKARVPAWIRQFLEDAPACLRVDLVDYGCGHGQHVDWFAAHRKVRSIQGRDLDPQGRPIRYYPVRVRGAGWGPVLPSVDDGHASIVYASNVLNVQPDAAGVARVVRDMVRAGCDGAWLVLNYPESPRRWGASQEHVRTEVVDAMAGAYGVDASTIMCERVAGTKRAPVWLVRSPWPFMEQRP